MFRHTIFLLLLGFTLACSEQFMTVQNEETASDDSENKSGSGKVDDGKDNEGDDDSSDGFEKTQASTQVTGASLAATTFECETEQNEATSSSTLTCEVYIDQDSVSTSLRLFGFQLTDWVKATSLANGYNPSWSLEKKFGDSFNGSYNCQEQNNGLTYYCEWPDDYNAAVKVSVNLTINHTQDGAVFDLTKTVDFDNPCLSEPTTGLYNAFGSGVAGDPYIICNKAQFENYATNACGQSSSAGCGYHLSLGSDLDMTGLTNVIGYKTAIVSNAYTGTFLGNGYTIRNLDFSITASSSISTGLFEVTSFAHIEHINFDDVSITHQVNANRPTGLVVGLMFDGTLSQVHVRNLTISNSLTNTLMPTKSAGLVFENSGTISYSSVQGEFFPKTAMEQYAGLVHKNNGSGIVEKSFVDVEMLAAQGAAIFGPIAYENNGFIRNSYSKGSVTSIGTITSGGLLVTSSSNIQNCLSLVTFNVTGSTVGGFVSSTSPATNSRNYWLNQGQSVNGGIAYDQYSGNLADTEIAGKTMAELQDPDDATVYVGWDFDTIWEFTGPNTYPTLRDMTGQ